MKTKIYTLLHPITKEIRYVGKTIQSLDTRLAGHIRDSFRHRTHNGNWIRGLLSRGLYPEIMTLDECDNEIWTITEQYWIAQFKAWGFRLTNQTEGGDGNQNQVITEENRRRTSESLKKAYAEGRFGDSDTRRKQSEARMGHVPSQATRDKLRNHNLGKRASEESKQKKRKAVQVFDKDEVLIEEYIGLTEAAKHYNALKGTISNACNNRGGRNKLYGKFWKFKSI